MPINLILADGHPLILFGMNQLLSSEGGFNVLASCEDGEQVLQATRQHQPDILVLDLQMPKIDGLTIFRELSKEKSPTKVVILAAKVNEDEVLEAIRLGARGVVLKNLPLQLLLQCLRIVHDGGEWIDKSSTRLALEKLLQREETQRQRQQLSYELTSRELELTRLAANGLNNREIATKLFISEGTVKVHLHKIFDKLNVKTRSDLRCCMCESRALRKSTGSESAIVRGRSTMSPA